MHTFVNIIMLLLVFIVVLFGLYIVRTNTILGVMILLAAAFACFIMEHYDN